MPELWELAVVDKPRSLSAEVRESVPLIIQRAGDRATWRFLEFFTATIRNRNTREAYARSVRRFCEWLDAGGVKQLAVVNPVIVAAYIEKLTGELSKPSVKQHLAGC